MGEKEQPGEVSFILFVGTQEKEGQREEGKVSHFVLAGPHKKKNEPSSSRFVEHIFQHVRANKTSSKFILHMQMIKPR